MQNKTEITVDKICNATTLKFFLTKTNNVKPECSFQYKCNSIRMSVQNQKEFDMLHAH